jgi:methyl-accepting chemotaxis protein
VAAGDLTVQINDTAKDETGALLAALKAMNDNLHRIVTEVRQGSDTINTASAEIATGNLDLSSRTEQQAGALEETASAMEELTSTVKQNADNARQANTWPRPLRRSRCKVAAWSVKWCRRWPDQ